MDYQEFKQKAEALETHRLQKLNLLPPFKGEGARELETLRSELTKGPMSPHVRPSFSKGLDLVFEDLQRHLSGVELQQIQDECLASMSQWTNLDNSSPPNPKALMNLLDSTPDTLQGLLGLSEKTMETMYQAGLRYFNSGFFEDAKAVFWMLVTLSPLRHILWIALGLTTQQSGHAKEALDYFANAALLSPDDLSSYIHAADCHLALNEKILAENTLKAALEITPTESQTPLQQQIRNWLASPTFS